MPTTPMQFDESIYISDAAIANRYQRACPYCHHALGQSVDAEMHIIGCSDQWRRHHHVDPTPGPGIPPSVCGSSLPDSAALRIETSSELARRITGSHMQSDAFRSFVGYEPTP